MTSTHLRAFAIAGLLIFSVACTEKVSHEARIQKVLDEGVAALEEGKVAEAGELLSEDYSDRAGRDKKTLKRIAFFMLRGQKASFFLRETQIEVALDAKTAKVVTELVVGGRKAEVESLGDVLPTGMRKLNIELNLAREGDEWRITRIDGDGLRAQEE